MPPASSRTAADVMTPAPRTCSPFSTVLEAVLIFRDADCGAVPIVDQGKPLGILTDRDVALALSEYPDLAGRAVADIMTKGVITVTPETPLSHVEATMTDNGVRRVVVIDNDGRIVGILSWADLVQEETDAKVGEVVSDVLEQA